LPDDGAVLYEEPLAVGAVGEIAGHADVVGLPRLLGRGRVVRDLHHDGGDFGR
jgi:hypothetical protein